VYRCLGVEGEVVAERSLSSSLFFFSYALIRISPVDAQKRYAASETVQKILRRSVQT